MRSLPMAAWALAILLTASATLSAGASVDRPSWTAGDYWSYRTNTTILPGLNLTGTATSTLVGSQATAVGSAVVDALQVLLEGSGTAEGTVRVGNVTASVRGDWIVTGEERYEPGNLHVVYSLLDLSVNGTYQGFIPVSIRVQNTTTFQPLTDRWAYPLAVGGNGTLTVAYTFTQDVYAIGGNQYHANGTGQWDLRFSLGEAGSVATPAGTFTAYPEVETFPDGSSNWAWYAPQVGNDVRTKSFDPEGNLTSETALVAYRYQALEPTTFLGLTLLEWAVVASAVAVAVIAVLLIRRARGRKAAPAPEPGAGAEVTSGPRGP